MKRAERPEAAASVTAFEPYLAEMRRARRWRRVRNVALATFGTALLAALTWLVGFSPILALQSNQIAVSIEPGSLVDADEVAGLLRKHIGTPLVRINLGGVQNDAEQLLGVNRVNLSRAWPNGISVQVESRLPAGAVAVDGGYAWVDHTGVVVGHFEERADLPRIEADLDEPRVVAETLAVWAELPESLQGQVRHVSAGSIDSISTTLTTGQVIHWGCTSQLKLKIATAQALLDTAPGVWVVDVSSPLLPVTR